MPKNSYFQFKQFRVEQGNCAMKVSTDACIFGAYLPVAAAQKILDIGTGTGLLALMLAQRCEAFIEAVEIDEVAAQQAQTNFEQSIWQHRLRVWAMGIQDFCNQFPDNQYDWIVSNPPFFVNATLSTNLARRIARHTLTLDFEDLWHSVHQLLSPEGNFAVILPPTEMQQFRSMGGQLGFFPYHCVTIRDSERHTAHRQIMIFRKEKRAGETVEQELLIKDTAGNYSSIFKKYMNNYYLYL